MIIDLRIITLSKVTVLLEFYANFGWNASFGRFTILFSRKMFFNFMHGHMIHQTTIFLCLSFEQDNMSADYSLVAIKIFFQSPASNVLKYERF